MSEIYIELKLRLPRESAKEIAKLFEGANPNLGSANSVGEFFQPLGGAAAELFEQVSKTTPDWVDEQLTLEEQLTPQDFGSDGRLAKIQFIHSDHEQAHAMADFLESVFSASDIQVAGTQIYSEDDLEEDEFSDDEDDEFSHLEF